MLRFALAMIPSSGNQLESLRFKNELTENGVENMKVLDAPVPRTTRFVFDRQEETAKPALLLLVLLLPVLLLPILLLPILLLPALLPTA